VTIRIATRGSQLARWQADHIGTMLGDYELVVVATEGDRRTDVPLSQIGGKGLFVKEVQAAVLDGRADVAVHSAKDLPARTPEGICLAAVPERADVRDGLAGVPFDELPEGARVATGSQRRRVQIRALRPDLEIVDVRGNIGTRLARLAEGRFDALVVAVAALQRLGLGSQLATLFDPEVMLPQVGQGALAVECRSDDVTTRERLAAIDHGPTHELLDAERAFLAAIGGDCDLPAGALARHDSDGITLEAMLALDAEPRRTRVRGGDPTELGRRAAVELGAR
jgi:hydroxymethylbilane synthase